MTDYERTILNHYNLTTPYPNEWPAENDDSDASDDDLLADFKNNLSIRRSKSRYSALERSGSDRRSLVPGTERTGNGAGNLVQKDEPDPLGGPESVVRILRQRGLPVEDDARLRNRFMLSSTTFSPALFLSQVHSEASTQSLLQGLEFLSRSIDQKSASLKLLVESNFERFVRAKATIDNVYTEMRNQGIEKEQEKRLTHSRHASKSSTHLRNGSLHKPGPGHDKPLSNDRRKNALIRESEYGVQGIKAPLIEGLVKAEEVWGPALGGRERENSLKAVLESIESYRGIFDLGASIADGIKRKDYESVVEDYLRARRYADKAKDIADTAISVKTPLTDSELHRIIVTGRMWLEVDGQIEHFKRDIWRKLTGLQSNFQSANNDSQPAEHMELIRILLELGVEDNPIWVWLLSRYDHLRSKINSTFERSRVEIEVYRRELATRDKPNAQTTALHLRSSSQSVLGGSAQNMDSTDILELWEHIYNSFNGILSKEGGILGEVIDFWESAQSFIDGKVQKTLPTGIEGQSQKHHRLSSDGIRDLQNGTIELVGIIRDNVFSFFADPPIEDISMLFSPLPPSTPSTPKSTTLAPDAFQESRFKFDRNNLPPPSPKRGEAWEEFAFWPPYANSLSAVHYLSKLLILVSTAASEMATMSPVAPGTSALERLKLLVGGARERSVRAVCAAWNKDAEEFKLLENWTRSPDKKDLTKMPSQFTAFESWILAGTQKLLYLSEAMTKQGSADVVTPPPAKLLQWVRSQFVASLYKALSGMVEIAEKSEEAPDDEWSNNSDGLALPSAVTAPDGVTATSINARSRNVRILLTLSNVKAIRGDVVPQLITQFETSFSVKLAEESKTIRDVLGQIESRLFNSYTKPTVEKLSSIIHAGISTSSWMPTTSKPAEVRPYVYDTLLLLVLVHTEVSTTASSLTSQILSYNLEQVSIALLEAFKKRQKYSLPALMQATLDVEFMAQTLSQYTTDKASDTQSQIYLELDRGTDNDARMRLQDELPDMRATLKRLRESTRGEFACFKKQRGQRERS